MTNEAVNLLKKMMKDRIDYYAECRDFELANAYQSVLTMLQYAEADNFECLYQFDYFGENA